MRSLRAGHPVPIAISMVSREMPDPIGTEFGILADEVTYGADLETAMRNLYYDLTKMMLAGAACWMLLGNLIMYRLVNFRI